MGFRIFNPFVVAQAKGIGIIEEISPLAHHTGFGLGTHLPHHVEEGGLGVVLRQQDGREGGMVFVPGDSGKLHRGAVHHSRPVGAADGGAHRAFVQRPAAFFHHRLDKGSLSLFHTPGSPAVQADYNHVGGKVLLRCLPAGNHQQRSCQS